MRLNHRSAPLRFVAATVLGWTALRAAVWMPWGGAATVAVVEPAALAAAEPVAKVPAPVTAPAIAAMPVPTAAAAVKRSAAHTPPQPDARPAVSSMPPAEIAPAPARREPLGTSGTALAPPAPIASPPVASPPVASPWSGSAWAFFRRGSGQKALASGGQLGGSQAGARIAYRLIPSLAAAARISTAIGVPGSEAAVGLDWLIGPALRLSAERRIAIDRGGRNAWSAYAAAGFYRERFGLVIDGYAQAGVVGARRRDLFADGAVRVVRPIAKGIGIGGGVWGAAQPGVARLDVGPRAALRLPAGVGVLAVEGRTRVAGRARPGGGIAVTLAKDF